MLVGIKIFFLHNIVGFFSSIFWHMLYKRSIFFIFLCILITYYSIYVLTRIELKLKKKLAYFTLFIYSEYMIYMQRRKLWNFVQLLTFKKGNTWHCIKNIEVGRLEWLVCIFSCLMLSKNKFLFERNTDIFMSHHEMVIGSKHNSCLFICLYVILFIL